MKKSVSILLSVLLMVFCAIPVMGAEAIQNESKKEIQDISLRWLQVTTINPYLSIKNGTASILVNANAKSGVAKTKITTILQKANSTNYTNVKTFTKTVTGTSCTLSDSYSCGSGTFRLKTTVTTYNSSGTALETTDPIYTYA